MGRVAFAFGLMIALAALVAFACSDGYGDDNDPGRTAPDPALPAGAALLAEGEREIELAAGESFGLDTVDFAGDQEIAAPGCAAYVFAYGWAVTEPDDGTLRIDSTRQNETVTVSEEPSGSDVAGCAFLEFVNAGDEDIAVQLRYQMGELR